jgi:hypothetical protein
MDNIGSIDEYIKYWQCTYMIASTRTNRLTIYGIHATIAELTNDYAL